MISARENSSESTEIRTLLLYWCLSDTVVGNNTRARVKVGSGGALLHILEFLDQIFVAFEYSSEIRQ